MNVSGRKELPHCPASKRQKYVIAMNVDDAISYSIPPDTSRATIIVQTATQDLNVEHTDTASANKRKNEDSCLIYMPSMSLVSFDANSIDSSVAHKIDVVKSILIPWEMIK